MILKKINTLAIATLFIFSAMAYATPLPVLADHTEVHCEQQFPDNDNDNDLYRECIANLPQTTAEKSAWCELNRPDSEFEECMLDVFGIDVRDDGGGDDGGGDDGGDGGIGDGGTANFGPQGGELEIDPGELNVDEDNPIFNRLNQIINAMSVGVGIVITISVVYAGIQYIVSRGDPQLTQKAVQRIWQAGIALFLYIFGWALLNWLIPGGVL